MSGFLTCVSFTDLLYGRYMSAFGFQTDNNKDHVSPKQSEGILGYHYRLTKTLIFFFRYGKEFTDVSCVCIF